jgi:hypothetical protein
MFGESLQVWVLVSLRYVFVLNPVPTSAEVNNLISAAEHKPSLLQLNSSAYTDASHQRLLEVLARELVATT